MPTSVDADKVPAHRAVFVEEHCALRDDVAGVTIEQHLLSNSLIGGHEPDGWDSWVDMRADVIVRSKPIEKRMLRCIAIAPTRARYCKFYRPTDMTFPCYGSPSSSSRI